MLAFEQILSKMLQVWSRGAHDRMRARRRNNSARPANEQRIVEGLAQPPQRLADGGLAHAELSRRTAHTELVVERDDDGQQVEVGMLWCHPCLRPSELHRQCQRAAFVCLAKKAKMSGMLPEITLP